MKRQTKIIIISFLFGLSFWVIDSVTDSLFYYRDTFSGLLILRVPPHEVYIRLVIVSLFLLFGFVISRIMKERELADEKSRKSELKFHNFFKHCPISLWEEDFSEVLSYLKELENADNGMDLSSYLGTHPEEIIKCAGLIRILDINPATLKIYHAENKEEILADLNNVFTAESLPVFKDQLIALYNNKEAAVFDGVNRTMNGDKIFVEVRSSFFNDNQAVVSVVDITERYMAEDKLRKSQERYRFLSENMADIVWTLDRDFRTTYVSPSVEKVLGYTPEERKKQSLDEVITSESLEKVMLIFQEELQREQNDCTDPERSITVEVEYFHRNGSLVWMENNVKAIRDENGALTGLYGASRNISDRKKAEEKIQRLLREKEILLKEVHHRIKNNMNIIRSLLVLQSQALGMPEVDKIFQDAVSRIESMGILYEKLYRKQDYNDVSIKDYLSRLIDEIFDLFPESKFIRIEKRIDDFTVVTDTIFTLGIIINELLTNSLKYAFTDREVGNIVISAMRNNGSITIIFEDNGIGISELEKTEQRGFGLELVELLVKQLKGSCLIEKNNGTRFIIEFEI